jgi:hypothetical protein
VIVIPVLIAVSVIAAGCLIYLWTRHPARIAEKVPLGSSVSDLSRVIDHSDFESTHVWEYVLPKEDPNPNDLVTTPYGEFEAQPLGSFREWIANPHEQQDFTGEIKFYYHTLWGSLVSIRFVYKDGKVVGKDWGEVVG